MLNNLLWGGFVILFFSVSGIAFAVNEISLSIQSIGGSGQLHLQGVKLKIGSLQQSEQTFIAGIEHIVLPPPLQNQLSFAQIECSKLIWRDDLLACQQGSAAIDSEYLKSDEVTLQFSITDNKSDISFSAMPFAKGIAHLHMEFEDNVWHAHLQAKNLQVESLQKIISLPDLKLQSGFMDIHLSAHGTGQIIDQMDIIAKARNLQLSNQLATLASEALTASAKVQAVRKRDDWQLSLSAEIFKGGLYIDPVFLEFSGKKNKALQLDAIAELNELDKHLTVKQIALQHPEHFSLMAKGNLYQSDGRLLDNVHFDVSSQHLDNFSNVYWKPYVTETPFEGFEFQGQLKLTGKIEKKQLLSTQLKLTQLELQDKQQRLAVEQGKVDIQWSNDASKNSISRIGWKTLHIAGIPLQHAEMRLVTDAQRIRFAKAFKLPMLDGYLNIDSFDVEWFDDKEPEVYLRADLQKLSLERLTEALQMLPLSGDVNGSIPGISLQDGKVSLDGEINVHIFDGRIRISHLSTEHLFSDYPLFFADLEIDNLDLNQLTQKFSFGYMEGRLSGYIRKMYLENWQPVTFYAWFGTPDDDDSRHRISQKAVQNIASIGGGGAADAISKGVLGIFETFSYDKLGLGCYLHNGVCQLMGVASKDGGYYIIAGGGLPRIDVIGYNPRVDWDVLLERLKRLTTTNEAIIE